MALLIIVLIIAVIALSIENNDLKKEIEKLKQSLFNKISFCPNCGLNLSNLFNKVNFCPKCGYNFISSKQPVSDFVKINETVNRSKKLNDREIKNSFILIVGSILIVIAAIVFLASTWSVVHNIVKTIVFLAMLVVFLAISYISSKLRLTQTSKAFYYIALSYIPIILLSISMFELFGKYLSINGAGKYIYLTISFVVVCLIYYYDSFKRKIILTGIFSYIFQVLSIIMFLSIFNVKSVVIFSGILVYNFIFMIFYLKNKFYVNRDVHKILCSILCVAVTFFTVLGSLIMVSVNNVNIFDIIVLLFNFINIYTLVIKIYNKNNVYKYIYPLFIILIFYTLSKFFDYLPLRQAIILGSFAIIYIYNVFKEHKINIITYIEILVVFSIFNFSWMLINSILSKTIMDSYLSFGFVTYLSLASYIYDKQYKKVYTWMFSTGLIITILSIISSYNLPIILIGYCGLALIVLGIMIKDFKIPFKWIGIGSIIMYIFTDSVSTSIWDVFLYSSYFITSFVLGIQDKDDSYKISSYIALDIVLFSFLDFYGFNYFEFIIPFTTIAFTLLERFNSFLRSKVSNIYLMINYILSIIIMLCEYNLICFMVLCIVNFIFVYYIIFYNKNKNYLAIPFMGIIPYVYFSEILIVNNFNLMFIVSILFLLLFCYLIYNKTSNIYISLFYLYNLFQLICFEEFKYINILILILGSFICYLIKKDKIKDMYKSLIYLLWVILYNNVLIDLDFSHINSLEYISYVILGILIIRTILVKYKTDYKTYEYIFCIIINFLALFNYSSTYDGILYIILLLILVIVFYSLRYGPAFLICLINILINVLILTRDVWLNIPWWIYILIVGSVLIAFAVHNELKDKKVSKSNNIKNFLDL